MATARWIIGRGLLGTAVRWSRADEPLHVPIRWADPEHTRLDLAVGLDLLAARPEEQLEIYWCAGRGVTSSTREQLDIEVGVFEEALRMMLALPDDVRQRLSVFLASSVGGAYAGSEHPPFTESTAPRPASEYGRAKLRMETALADATRAGMWRAFVARITNLYGPGQDMTKGQGLISVIVASFVTGKPVSIFVPLDTLRDYIYEDDCARVIQTAMKRVAAEPRGTLVMKIVGAMTALSIGAILGESTRLRRKRAPIILGQGNGIGQAYDLRVRSEVWPDLDGLVRTTLPEGLANIYRSQLAQRATGAAR